MLAGGFGMAYLPGRLPKQGAPSSPSSSTVSGRSISTVPESDLGFKDSVSYPSPAPHPTPTPTHPHTSPCFPVPHQGARSPGACRKPKTLKEAMVMFLATRRMGPRYTGRATMDSLVYGPKLQVRKEVGKEKLAFPPPRPALGCL